MKQHTKLLSTLLAAVMLLACAPTVAMASTDELNEIAGIRTPGTNITTTTVTATTSDGKTETYDIVIDHDFYDIVYNTVTNFMGVTGTRIITNSDASSDTIGDYKYIENIVIPETVTSIISCSGKPSIVVVPKSVTYIGGFFGMFGTMADPEATRQNFLENRDNEYSHYHRYDYNDYYPYLLILYEGTEAEWQAIAKPSQTDSTGTFRPNKAQELYDLGYVRFNCNYYDIVNGTSNTAPAQPTSPTVSGFSDVTADKYYAESVKWAVDENITKGVTATTFQPNSTCTQAQIITFIWRAQGSPKVSTVAPYDNITSANYYYDAVNWAYANGMIDGSFNPNSPCSRSLAMQFLYALAGKPAVTSDEAFTDVSNSARYHDAVYWAVQQGITNGTSDTTFSPSNTCTRAQIVTFLWRAWA